MEEQGLIPFLAVTGFGKVMDVILSQRVVPPPSPIMWFHYGPLYAVQPVKGQFEEYCTSGGDDRWLCLWNRSKKMQLETRARALAPIRCICVDHNNDFVVVGMCGGLVSVFHMESCRKQEDKGLQRANPTLAFTFKEMLTRKDCEEDISDIKFSPNNHMLAIGSHDNFIDIYSIQIIQPTKYVIASFSMRQIKRCRGHTSYITHLDWSDDNRLIKSTCGAYELMYWDVSTGKQCLSSYDTLEADTEWNTNTCTLGFQVMAIWPKNTDGTDINCIDVCPAKGVVVTGDDFGKISLFNYPCIVKNAPSRCYTGHSSHVMCIKFSSFANPVSNSYNNDNDMTQRRQGSSSSSSDGRSVITAGGNDACVMLWNIFRFDK